MKGKGNTSLIILGILVLILLSMGAEKIFAVQFHRGNLVSSTEELSIKITEELTKGHESFRTYVNGLSEEQLVSINQNIDGFFGHVSTYTVLRKVNADVLYIHFELEVSNNYYAYQKLVNGKEIVNNQPAEILALKVQQVINDCPANSDYEKVVRYHDYIVSHTQYGFIEGEDEMLSYTAAGALLHGKAVCNGYAEALELLLMCSGVDTKMVVGATDEGNHAWNMVNLDGNWYHVDATWDDPVPDSGDNILHVYVNVSDDIMSKTHIWNRNAYPECVNLDYNYYEQENKAFDTFNDFKAYVLREMQSKNKVEVMVKDGGQVQYDCGFVIKEGGANSVSWQSYEDGNYMVMMIDIDKR